MTKTLTSPHSALYPHTKSDDIIILSSIWYEIKHEKNEKWCLLFLQNYFVYIGALLWNSYNFSCVTDQYPLIIIIVLFYDYYTINLDVFITLDSFKFDSNNTTVNFFK